MKLTRWEFIGIIIISAIGVFLHFAYELSDNNQFVALVAPINESIWEHLKMAFYGMIIFALIEYIFLGQECKNFIFAKAFSSLVACFLTVVFYYGYTHFTAHNLYLDIIVFVAAILVAQFFSYIILKTKMYIKGINYIGLLVIFCAAMVFASYTYQPPHTELFTDTVPED